MYKRAVGTFDLNSKIAQHVHKHDHTFDFDNVQIIDKATTIMKDSSLKRGTRSETLTQETIQLTLGVFTPLCANFQRLAFLVSYFWIFT